MNNQPSTVIKITLPLPIEGLPHVNVYLLRVSKQEYCLIDSGWSGDDNIASFKNSLASLRIKPSWIRKVIITHSHHDHIGGIDYIKRLTEAEICIHRVEQEHMMRSVEWLSQLDGWLAEHGLDYRSRREITELIPKFAEYRDIHFDKLLKGGEKISLEDDVCSVFHLPGHTPGHVVLFLEWRRELIAGDVLLPDDTPNVSYIPKLAENPLAQYLDSLDRIRRLRPKMVHPAHGDVIVDAEGRIDELCRHHGRRLFEALVASRGLTTTEVARRITWSKGFFDELSPPNKWLALSETLSHLEYLRYLGLVKGLHDGRRALWLTKS